MFQILRDSKKLSRFTIPVMATEGFLKSKSSDYGWFVSEDYLLPFFIEKKFIFKRLVFSSEPIPLGNVHVELGKQKAFINEVSSSARKTGAHFIYQPLTNAIFKCVPEDSTYCGFGTFLVDLRLSEQELFDNLHKKHRNVIRKAQSNGVSISSGAEYLDSCYALIRQTMERQNRPYVSYQQLKKYQDNLGDKISFYIAEHDGVVHGCAILLWQEGYKSHYLHGGSSSQPASGAMNLLHWQAMLDMKRNGVHSYDFVGARLQPLSGSKQESMQRFKSRFGAELERGYLWKKSLSPLAYKGFQITARLNALLKGQRYSGDIIDEELLNNVE